MFDFTKCDKISLIAICQVNVTIYYTNEHTITLLGGFNDEIIVCYKRNYKKRY